MNPAWIQHEWIFSIFWLPKTPNHQSKTPFTQSCLIFLTSFFQISIESDSCRFHAGFKHNPTWNFIFRFMSDSCWIHTFSMILRFGVELDVFPRFWFKFFLEERLVLNSRRSHTEFMLISCWMSFLPWIFTTLCATFCITMVLNSCWSNSCWIQAKRWKVAKFAKKVAFEAFNWSTNVIYYKEYSLGFLKKNC